MISAHLQATRDVEDGIKTIRNIVEQIPDGLPKYRLQARLELMESTMQQYIKTSGEYYDLLLEFSVRAAV